MNQRVKFWIKYGITRSRSFEWHLDSLSERSIWVTRKIIWATSFEWQIHLSDTSLQSRLSLRRYFLTVCHWNNMSLKRAVTQMTQTKLDKWEKKKWIKNYIYITWPIAQVDWEIIWHHENLYTTFWYSLKTRYIPQHRKDILGHLQLISRVQSMGSKVSD